MKICLFTLSTPYYQGGGFERFLVSFSSWSGKNLHHSVEVVSRDRLFHRKLSSILALYYGGRHIKIADIPHLSQEEAKAANLRECPSWKELADRLCSYDVIYSKNELIEVVALRILGLFFKLPRIVYGIHTAIIYESPSTLTGRFHNFIYCSPVFRALLANAHSFHSLNKETYDYLKQYFPLKSNLLLPNGVDPNTFRDRVRPRDPKTFKVIWVGRLTDQKGVHNLIKIIQQTNASLKQKIEWHIIGTGELVHLVDALCKKETNVVYHGWVENSELPSIYQNMDLFISTSKWEGMPLTVIEAMFSGLPVVSFKIPGVIDIINDQKQLGVLVSNISEFNDTIQQIAAKNIVFNNVREYALTKYSLTNIYPILFDYLSNQAIE